MLRRRFVGFYRTTSRVQVFSPLSKTDVMTSFVKIPVSAYFLSLYLLMAPQNKAKMGSRSIDRRGLIN
jgi:hypothetical protein